MAVVLDVSRGTLLRHRLPLESLGRRKRNRQKMPDSITHAIACGFVSFVGAGPSVDAVPLYALGV